MKKFGIFLLSLFFISGVFGLAQEKIEFESVLINAQYSPVTGKEYGGIWVLRFENNIILSIIQDSLGKTRGTVWIIGKKYKVSQKLSTDGLNFNAELMEKIGIPKIDRDVEKRLVKKKTE